MNSNAFSYIYAELSTGNIVNVPLDMLETKSFREKTDDDHLSALNLSMGEEGVLENILIMADEKNEKFLILEGNYRVEALRHLEEETVPAKLLEKHPYLSTLRAKAHRMDHSAIEIATLCQKALGEGYTQTELAAEFGIPKSTVCELVKFTLLPDYIKEAAHKDSKKFNHDVLRKLVKLEGDAQEAAFQEILKKENKKATTSFSSVQKQLERTLLKIKKLSQEERNRLKKTVMDIMTELDDSSLRTTSNLEEAPVTRDTETVEAATELPTPNSIESSNAPSFSCEVSQGEPTYPIVEVASETQAETPMQADHQIKDAA